jgi:hypothetical protein
VVVMAALVGHVGLLLREASHDHSQLQQLINDRAVVTVTGVVTVEPFQRRERVVGFRLVDGDIATRMRIEIVEVGEERSPLINAGWGSPRVRECVRRSVWGHRDITAA